MFQNKARRKRAKKSKMVTVLKTIWIMAMLSFIFGGTGFVVFCLGNQ